MSDHGTAPRYAVYYAPDPGHALWSAGCTWLGRDPAAEAAHSVPRPQRAEPWRYGFHATLKPPMRLAGRDEAALQAALERLASGHAVFAMPALSVQWLADFLALQPTLLLGREHPLHRLADACVTELDGFRAPPTPEELRRRHSDTLNAAQRELLARYGYPHVLAHWRFHMTLSDSLPPDAELRHDLQCVAEAHFASALAQPLRGDAICLFVEPAPGAPLRLLRRFPLRTPT